MNSVKLKKETTMGSKERPDQVYFITSKLLKEPKRLETLNPNPRARPAGWGWGVASVLMDSFGLRGMVEWQKGYERGVTVRIG